MAEHQLALAVAEVHAAAPAEAEVLALCALVLLHPLAVAVGSEALLPDIHEVILVNIALVIVGTDAGAGRDGAVGEDGAYADTRLAEEEMVAHIALVVAEKALTAIADVDASLLACRTDEVHDLTELLRPELEVGIAYGATRGEDGEEAPVLEAEADEEFAQLLQPPDVALVDTGDHIEEEVLPGNHQLDGIDGALVAEGVAAHPVMVVLKAVEADGGAVHAAAKQTLEALGRETHAVGHHAPGEALVVDSPSALLKVGAHERLAAGDDDEDLVGIRPLGHLVEDAQEILLGHVGRLGLHLAVASAMLAMEVAAQRTLPEELAQRMLGDEVILQLARRLQSDATTERKFVRGHDE